MNQLMNSCFTELEQEGGEGVREGKTAARTRRRGQAAAFAQPGTATAVRPLGWATSDRRATRGTLAWAQPAARASRRRR